MSTPKDLVDSYFDGFNRSDHTAILACLADGVVWDIPGHVQLTGKAAFDAEIENPAFSGSPVLRVDRLVEESGTVVAIGEGSGHLAEGDEFTFAFCTVFTISDALISRVESFVVPLTS